MFYAAKNHQSSETSVGFSNTWYVVGFEAKKMRDAHVANSDDMATKCINSKDVIKYGYNVGKLSYYDANGHYHQYMGNGEFVKCDGMIIDATTGLAV